MAAEGSRHHAESLASGRVDSAIGAKSKGRDGLVPPLALGIRFVASSAYGDG